MRKKKIFLIRHGQTDYNKRGVVQGSGIDAPLNETGINQAEAFYQAYKDLPFQKVYTSVLQRSIQSVDSFIQTGLPHSKLSGLNEINWGEKEGKVANEGDHKYYTNIIKSWREGKLDRAIPGGESPVMVLERQKPALQHILNDEEELVLVCMHGRAMRILLCLMLNKSLSQMDQYEHANLCLYVLEYNYDNRLFKLIVNNEQSHLGKLATENNYPKKP